MNCSKMSGQSGKYRMWVFFMFFLTISPGKALQLNKTEIDNQVSLFSTDLADFFEKVLGAKKLQKIYDSGKNTKYIHMESKNVLQRHLHNDLRKELLLVENSLDVLKKQLEGSYTQQHKMPRVQECSAFNGPWSYTAKFRQGIHWKSCLLNKKQQEIDSVIQEQEHFLKESIENSSSAFWHYIVTEEKDLYQFPIGQQKNTSVKQASEFARRLLAASHFVSAHRNMAIVIAVSNITMWEAMINTLENVLETLFDADQVALMLVNGTNVVSLHGCENQTLETNRYNIDVIKSKLRNVHGLPEVVKSAGVSEALKLAFQALNISSAVEHGSLPINQNVLLFLTSGIEDGATEVVKAMEQGQAQLATPAHLFLYGLDNSTLSNLAIKSLTTVVHDFDGDLSDYYAYLQPSVLPPGQDYIYFGPHYDSSVGMALTIGAPFSTENGTKGVVATDVSVATLFRSVLDSQIGAKSHALVVDRRTGNIIAHPRLPLPSELHAVIPTLYVTDMEPQLPRSLLQDLNKGYSSFNVPGMARRHVPDDVHEELIEDTAMYSISPLEKSPFAIILVLVDGDTQRDYSDYHYQPKPRAYYYRYDILDNMGRDPTLCNRAGVPVAKHQSVIKLSPNVFHDPFYPWSKESGTHAEFVQTFLRTGRNGTFLRDPTAAKAILVDTYRSDELVSTWREHDQLPVQRYLGTRNGVARLYPGQLLDGGFDPRKQQWYRNAARLSQIMVVSPAPSLIGPHIDGSRLLSVSKAIYEERSGISGHSRLDPVSAVVGADVSVHLLQSLLLEKVGLCLDQNIACNLLDNRGYMIIGNYDNKISDKTQHLTDAYPIVADILMNYGYIKAKACCFPISSGSSYELVLNTSSLYQVNGGCQQFVLQRILDTNMFLLAVLGNSTCLPSPKQSDTKECCYSEPLCKESGGASLCSDFNGTTSFTSLCPVTGRSNLKTIKVKPTMAVPGVPPCPRSCTEEHGQENCTAMRSCIWTNHLRYPVCVPSTEANFTVSPPQPTPNILTSKSPTPTPTLRPSRAPSPGAPTLKPGASTLKPGAPTLKPGGPTLRPGVSINQTGIPTPPNPSLPTTPAKTPPPPTPKQLLTPSQPKPTASTTYAVPPSPSSMASTSISKPIDKFPIPTKLGPTPVSTPYDKAPNPSIVPGSTAGNLPSGASTASVPPEPLSVSPTMVAFTQPTGYGTQVPHDGLTAAGGFSGGGQATMHFQAEMTGALQQGTTGSLVNMTTEGNGVGLNDEWLAWSNKTLAIVGSVIGGIVVLSILIGIFLKWIGWEFKLPTRESTAKLTSSKFDNPVYETDSEEDSLSGSMVSMQHRGYREF